MTRREEVEASIKSILHFAENFRIESDGLQHLARNLADEVDALRAEADPDALTICYMQGQAAGRDAERAENAELNATLDKLRDLLPEGGVWCYACNRATVPVWGEEPYEHIDPKYNQMKTTFRCSICKRDTHAKDSCVDTLRAILHPQPENENEQ